VDNNQEKQTYARVARVCQNDHGGNLIKDFKDIFFTKITLSIHFLYKNNLIDTFSLQKGLY
jgi:hypothetical protein